MPTPDASTRVRGGTRDDGRLGEKVARCALSLLASNTWAHLPGQSKPSSVSTPPLLALMHSSGGAALASSGRRSLDLVCPLRRVSLLFPITITLLAIRFFSTSSERREAEQRAIIALIITAPPSLSPSSCAAAPLCACPTPPPTFSSARLAASCLPPSLPPSYYAAPRAIRRRSASTCQDTRIQAREPHK